MTSTPTTPTPKRTRRHQRHDRAERSGDGTSTDKPSRAFRTTIHPMAPSNRSAQFTKLHKVLKKHYRPVASVLERPVLEQLLFACCLENARYNVAEEVFASLVEAFFDWNEVRVSSVRELAEVMARLPEPLAAADRFKRILQHVFEDNYSFDLEELRKKNLGPAVESLKKIDGVTTFSSAYVVQASLGGHAIPLDSGAFAIMRILDLASEEDVANGVIPGLERAIPKSAGIEFGSLLHQLSVDFTENPFAAAMRDQLLEVDPAAKSRLPKRESKKKAAEPAETPEEPKPRKAAGKTAASAADSAEKPKKKPAKKPTVEEEEAPAKKKAAREKKEPAAKVPPRGESTRKKAASAGLSKRKPR
jgi:endonuclease III